MIFLFLEKNLTFFNYLRVVFNKLPRGRALEVFTTNSQIFIYNL